MGTLKPDTKYIYERDGKNVYAREFGSTERQLIGQDYNGDEIKENQLWAEIRQVAKFNPSVKAALDQLKVVYELSKAD